MEIFTKTVHTFVIWFVCIDIIDGVSIKNQTFFAVNDMKMQNTISVLSSSSDLQCGRYCLSEDLCCSFGFTAATRICKLYDNDPLTAPSESSEAIGSVLYVKDCEEGWLTFGESCYLFSQTPKYWVDSKTYCESLGAHLAIVTNEAEHQFIRKTLSGQNKLYFWIGARFNSTAGEYRWIDGTEITFNGWRPGQPKGTPGCVDYLSEANWLWNHHGNCYSENGPYVCEKESNQVMSIKRV